jgi:Cu-processing system permease protein
MLSFLFSTRRVGVRSRSIQAILTLGVLLVGVAFLAAFFSPRQPITVAMDVGFSVVRVSLVLFALFWIQELVGQEIVRRNVIFALTYPVPRSHYLLGRYLGVTGLLALAALLLGMLLWLVVMNAGGGYDGGFATIPGVSFWVTVAGLWVDAAVVAAFALWIASLSTVPMLPLALGLAFAIAGKTLGAVMEYLALGAEGDTNVMRLAPLVDAIGWILPDLSRLDWRVWPMYGAIPDTSTLMGGLLLAVTYGGVMVALAIVAFSRREFEQA